MLVLFTYVVHSQQTNLTLTNYANTNIISGAASLITGNTHNTMLNYIFESMGTREYDATKTYTANKAAVLYNGSLWRCKTTISSAEAWNAAKWQQLTDTSLLWSRTGTTISSYSTNEVTINGALTMGTAASAPNGCIGLDNNKPIYWQSTTPTSTEVLNLNSSNIIDFYGGKATLNSSGVFQADVAMEVGTGNTSTSGDFRGDNATTYIGRNAANTANITLIQLKSDKVQLANATVEIDPANGNTDIDGYVAIGATPATLGNIRLPNASSIYFRNNANADNVLGLYVSATDEVYLGTSGVKILTDNTTQIQQDLQVTGNDTIKFTTGSDSLYIAHVGNYWKIESTGDTIQIGSNSVKIAADGNVVIDGDLEITGTLTAAAANTASASAYIATGDEAATTTTASGTYYFLKGSFTNNEAVNFGLTGDTLQYQGVEDISVTIYYTCTFGVGQVNTELYTAVSVNDVLQSQSEMVRTISGTSDRGSWAGMARITLSTNDKIKLIVKTNKAGGTATAYKFATIIQ